LAGNGGSAADAQHLAGKLVSRFRVDRPGLALALTSDTSAITAIGNDYGYDTVFARQVGAVGATGDVLIAISTSGASRNILLALEEGPVPRSGDRRTHGPSGGDIARLYWYVIRVPSVETPQDTGRSYRDGPHHLAGSSCEMSRG
jgi:D-sedoheptulose 7-phosphate isomerase